MAELTSDVKDLWFRCKRDRRYFFREFLRIRTLDNGKYALRPLILNNEQEQILAAIEEQEYEGRPVRIIIDKSRKVGVSTLVEAVAFHYCMFNKNAEALVIAHLQGATERIFDITRRYHENVPSVFDAVVTSKATGQKIRFKHGSLMEVMTQGSTDAARGSTPSFLHISELGLWDRGRATTSAEDVLQSTFGSIEDKAGTFVLIESTANGPRGAFYQRWKAAVENRPGNLFKPLFFGWHEHEHYRLEPLEGDEEMKEQVNIAYSLEDDDMIGKVLDELGFDLFWGKRMIEYDLDPCQVRWAHRTISTKFGGDIRRFDTEYPLSWQISFQSSGGSVFSPARIEEMMEGAAPFERGESMRPDGTLLRGGDSWEIYYPPDPECEYIVAVDTATGILEGDYACIEVFDRHHRRQVAEFYGKVPPDVLAKEVINVATSYNRAMVGPEVDGPGLALLRDLLDRYDDVYRRSTSTNWTQAFGYKTTHATREASLTELSTAVRLGAWEFNSKRFLRECLTFVYNQSGRAEALSSEHDDAVMACAIAIYVDKELGEVGQHSITSVEETYDRESVRSLLVRNRETIDPHLGVI